LVCAGVVLVLAHPLPGRAWAAPARVVVLQTTAAGPAARRCLSLIRDELAAGGFEVATVDVGPVTDPFSLAEAMRAQRPAVATIGLLGDPETPRAELWILDRIGGSAEVRRIPVPSENPDRVGEVLAIRAIEVLRASALKLLIESSRLPPTPAPAPAAIASARTPDEPAPSRRVVAVETGLSLLTSPGQLDPAALPLARVRIAVAGPLVARLTIAGLGSRPRLETSRGTATITQTIGLAELGVVFRRDRRLAPALMIGGGMLHVASDAQGIAPYLGQQDQRWSALVGAGAGLVATIGAGWAVALEAHVVIAAPYPLVRFADWEVATIARPAIWTTLTLVSWL
jgi:hypothetical protein